MILITVQSSCENVRDNAIPLPQEAPPVPCSWTTAAARGRVGHHPLHRGRPRAQSAERSVRQDFPKVSHLDAGTYLHV